MILRVYTVMHNNTYIDYLDDKGLPTILQKEKVRSSQGFWGTGEKGIYFRGTGEQRPNFEGNRGTKTILGNREHKKTNFRFLGNRGTSQFISGDQGNRYPPTPWKGLKGGRGAQIWL